jgi:phospholipase C
MLENRSFDHLVGSLNTADYAIDGLTGNESNRDNAGEPVPANGDARYSGDFDPDPGHDFDDVTIQLYGVPNPAPGQTPDMSGFVKSYAKRCGGNIPNSHRIMRCFDSAKLPAITTLAKNFAICNRWFASIPGPTLPNRLFAHCGTSGGRLDMAPDYFFSKFNTIYNVLDKANVSATIYADGWSGMASVTSLIQDGGQFFAGLDDSTTGFFTGCKRGRISQYSFLEPRYNSRLENDIVLPQNDQHPDSDVREGDNLIRRVYEAIRANDKIWDKCVFIITWDEHGGLYDHVPPQPAVPPGDKPSTIPAFDFSHYGVRVPAVVVSPYVAKGKIDSTVYDHTSLLATAAELLMKRRLAPNELWARAAAANSVSSCFDADLVANGPRTDRVDIPDTLGAVLAPKAGPLNDLQKHHLQQAMNLEQRLPLAARTRIDPSKIVTDVQADAYVKKVFEAAIENGVTDGPGDGQ